jgi:hypothetical protein
MYQFCLGVIAGVYLEQTYRLPNVYEKFIEIEAYMKLRKKD